MTHLGLSLNLSNSSEPAPVPEPSLSLTFTSTTVNLVGDDPLNTYEDLTPTFTINNTPSPINIKFFVTSGSAPIISKIQYRKNGGSLVLATNNVNFSDTFVNGDTLQIRVTGNGFGSESYFFELRNGSSTTISNNVQVIIAFEA